MSGNDMQIDADYRKSIGQVVDALIVGTRMDTLEQMEKLVDSLMDAEWSNPSQFSSGAYKAYRRVKAAIDTLKSVQNIYGEQK